MPAGDRAYQRNGKGLEKDGQGFSLVRRSVSSSPESQGVSQVEKSMPGTEAAGAEALRQGHSGDASASGSWVSKQARKRGEAKAQMAQTFEAVVDEGFCFESEGRPP